MVMPVSVVSRRGFSIIVLMLMVLVMRVLMTVVGMTVVLMMMTGLGHRVLAEELPALYRAAYRHKISVLTQLGQTG